jgi:DUF4097 and DUF4098 domain-containing protein YvlB
MMKIAQYAGLSLLLLAASETGSFDRTLQVTGGVTLDLRTGSGTIRIHAGADTSVHVSATIRAGDSWFGMSAREKIKKIESNPPISQTGNIISIGKIEDTALRNDVSIDYDLTVPAQTHLKSSSGSGNQTISGIKQSVSVSSGSGALYIDNAGADVRATTGSGSIKINSAKGPVEAMAGSGEIHAIGIGGDIRARTGSGNIEVEQSGPGNVEAHAGSGHLRLHGVKGRVNARTGSGGIEADGEPQGQWDLGAGSGGVELRFPAQASFNIDAESRSGRVTVNRQVTSQGTATRSHVQGKVGNGGPLVEIHTGSGVIQVN